MRCDSVQVEGLIMPERLEAVAELAEQGCRAVAKVMRSALLQRAQALATVLGLTPN